MFQYAIPEHTLEKWKSRVTVDLNTAIFLSTAMARTLLDSVFINEVSRLMTPSPNPMEVQAALLSLANDLQTILGDAMDMITAMSPHESSALKRGTFSQHLWRKMARHDILNIRRRTKTLQSLVNLAARSP
jgi:hypothetical protein